jgi:hypothetical protein
LELQPAISPTTDTQTGTINNCTVKEGQCPFPEYQNYLVVKSTSLFRMPHITHDPLQYCVMLVSYIPTIHICHWIWVLFTKTIPINLSFIMDSMCCSQEKWIYKTFRAEGAWSLWHYQITKHWSHPATFHCPPSYTPINY